nr:uncharacterized protein LOC109166242 isoform X2 [Ipomoea batatas]
MKGSVWSVVPIATALPKLPTMATTRKIRSIMEIPLAPLDASPPPPSVAPSAFMLALDNVILVERIHNMLNSSNDENVKEHEPVDDSQRSQVDGNPSVNDPKVSELQENPKKPKEEEVIKKKYGGLLAKKPPLISKDHERAFFDSADWALGKVHPSFLLDVSGFGILVRLIVFGLSIILIAGSPEEQRTCRGTSSKVGTDGGNSKLDDQPDEKSGTPDASNENTSHTEVQNEQS